MKKSFLEALVVFVLVLVLAASASGYLTFWVQFEKKKEPSVKKSLEASFQTLRVKDQERKQLHDHFHLATEDRNVEAWAEKDACIICHSPPALTEPGSAWRFPPIWPTGPPSPMAR